MPESDGKTIHSVAKAITLLDILTEKGKPVALTDLYRETGWPKSTIHGLLSTMRASGLIEQGADGRYWLGIRLFEYGCAVSGSRALIWRTYASSLANRYSSRFLTVRPS